MEADMRRRASMVWAGAALAATMGTAGGAEADPACGSSPLTVDWWKDYSLGTECEQETYWYGGDKTFPFFARYSREGAIHNFNPDDTDFNVFVCPLISKGDDRWFPGANGSCAANEVAIYVEKTSSPLAISCELVITEPFGFAEFSAGFRVTPATGVTKLSWVGPINPFPNDLWFIRCDIPGTRIGRPSGIRGYYITNADFTID
jgi:hypothetical protein